MNGLIPYEVEAVSKMDVWKRLDIYLHYYCAMLSLRHNFEVFYSTKPFYKNGLGTPHKSKHDTDMYWLWKDLKILTFDEFFSEDQIKVIDCGDKWKENGFAQQRWVELKGGYDWYSKNKHIFA